MTQPIFTLGLPNQGIPHEALSEIQTELEQRFQGYHVLVYTHSKEDVKFDLFSEKNITPIELEDLKQLVLNQIN